MKKFIALLLVAVMCLSFVACSGESGNTETPLGSGNTENNGGSTNESDSNDLDLCQEWHEIASGGTIKFDEEGNFYLKGQTFKYEYNSETNLVSIFYYETINAQVLFEDETYILSIYGEKYVPASKYEKFHSVYVTEKLASLTEGKTELVLGNTYTRADGTSFSFVDAKIIGDDSSCELAVFFDTYLVIGQASYITVASKATTGMGKAIHDSNESLSGYVFRREMEMTDLEADKADFGLLCFTIDDTIDDIEYYVRIDTFFQ